MRKKEEKKQKNKKTQLVDCFCVEWLDCCYIIFRTICEYVVDKFTKLVIFRTIGQGWEETVVKQEQSDDSQSEMKILLPSMPSLYIVSFLFRACEEVHRIGGHVLDRTILQKFALSLLENVSTFPGYPVLQ